MAKDEEVEDFLAHYGVPGMKWGRRKARSSTPTRTETHPDRVRVDDLKRNRPRTLSNKEIQHINNRLNLEKQLSSLKQESAQRTIKSGKSWADLAIATIGTAGALYGLSKTPIGEKLIKGVGAAIKR